MQDIKSLINNSSTVHEFSKGYFDYLYYLMKKLDVNSIAKFVEAVETARKEQRTIFIIGNGGSASTASHMSNDFALGARSDEELPFKALSLTDNVAELTAISNDSGYENLFIRQLNVFYRPKDVLIAISASGNSPNVVAAAKWVKERKGIVIGLVGFDGGSLKKISDILIHVKTPKGEYGPVEDIHMILDHLIYTWLWFKKRAEK